MLKNAVKFDRLKAIVLQRSNPVKRKRKVVSRCDRIARGGRIYEASITEFYEITEMTVLYERKGPSGERTGIQWSVEEEVSRRLLEIRQVRFESGAYRKLWAPGCTNFTMLEEAYRDMAPERWKVVSKYLDGKEHTESAESDNSAD